MKKLVKSLCLALLAIVVAEYSALAEERPTPAPTAKTKSFQVGMYQSANTLKMNLLIEKAASEKLTVTLRNEKNDIIYSEQVGKKSEKYWRKFDLDGMKDGLYRFEISNGKDKIVKEVELSTDKPIGEPERVVALN